ETHAEAAHLAGMRQQILISTAAGRLPQQVEVAERSCEREVESVADGALVPMKGQPFRGATQIWLVRLKCRHQATNVLAVARIHYAQPLGNDRRAGQRTRHTADDDELHPAARERGQGLLKIRNHVQRPDFATSGRNRPMKRVALTSCWARCSVVSRRFLSTNV